MWGYSNFKNSVNISWNVDFYGKTVETGLKFFSGLFHCHLIILVVRIVQNDRITVLIQAYT